MDEKISWISVKVVTSVDPTVYIIWNGTKPNVNYVYMGEDTFAIPPIF